MRRRGKSSLLLNVAVLMLIAFVAGIALFGREAMTGVLLLMLVLGLGVIGLGVTGVTRRGMGRR